MPHHLWGPLFWLLAASWCMAAGSLLGACGLHPGGDALAYVSGGQLWTIGGDGANRHAIASGAIVGFAWSPDHHQLVYRTLAHGSAAAALPTTPMGSAPDAPGDLFDTSINGGAPLQISPSSSGSSSLARSDAWWNPQGNRLLYRESYGAADTTLYIASQADQPLGIARKTLLDTATLPVLAPDGARVATIDPSGNVRVGALGVEGTVIATGALLSLPETGRPARVLWRPGHNALLYAAPGPSGVAYVLRDPSGGATRSISPSARPLDAAFSPDGARLLVHTQQGFELTNVDAPGGTVYTWPEQDPAAVAYWSPDGHLVLVADSGGLQLVNPTTHSVTPLLAYATQANPHAAQPGQVSPFWHPAAGSPWSPDGTRIVFVASASDRWRGEPLPAPRSAGGNTGSGATGLTGLYVAPLTSDGTAGAATLLGSGDVRGPDWSFIDPSAAFLLPS
jgi:dipeptidyl aminopeptidase/acylaminoacyl peptidase